MAVSKVSKTKSKTGSKKPVVLKNIPAKEFRALLKSLHACQDAQDFCKRKDFKTAYEKCTSLSWLRFLMSRMTGTVALNIWEDPLEFTDAKTAKKWGGKNQFKNAVAADNRLYQNYEKYRNGEGFIEWDRYEADRLAKFKSYWKVVA